MERKYKRTKRKNDDAASRGRECRKIVRGREEGESGGEGWKDRRKGNADSSIITPVLTLTSGLPGR